ncbi:MAG: hypothetical protein ACRCUY_07435 [Thermoguttaceae bacterium]
MNSISEPTDENRHSRVEFFYDLFEEMQKNSPDKIEWGETPVVPESISESNPHGKTMQFTPEILFDSCYVPLCQKVKMDYMENCNTRIDRHKIIAATQAIIIYFQPLRYVGIAPNDYRNRTLNTNYAFEFGIRFLCEWNVKKYPKNNFKNPNNKFDTEKFVYPLRSMDSGKRFLSEHKKLLNAMHNELSHKLPLFCIAQMWFLIEELCLTYARLQKTWPLEREPIKRYVN